jgi:hypothetical protein
MNKGKVTAPIAKAIDGRTSAAKKIARLTDNVKKLIGRAENAERVVVAQMLIIRDARTVMLAMDEHHQKNGDGSMKSVAHLIAAHRDRLEKAIDVLAKV